MPATETPERGGVLFPSRGVNYGRKKNKAVGTHQPPPEHRTHTARSTDPEGQEGRRQRDPSAAPPCRRGAALPRTAPLPHRPPARRCRTTAPVVPGGGAGRAEVSAGSAAEIPGRAGAEGAGPGEGEDKSQHERGNGAQRGEPQHACDEQPGHLAVLRPWHRAAARRAPQHPLLQRPRGLDSHQHHSQHEHVHLPAHRERNPFRDARPGQGAAADALGADGLRRAVHGIPQVPDHHAHRAVFSNQLLHQVRQDTLRHQHHLPDERPDPQTASVPRSADLWDQQVLKCADGGAAELGEVPPPRSHSPLPTLG